MGDVREITQIYSDVVYPCPSCRAAADSDGDRLLEEQVNHLLAAHGWRLLHVGQESTQDHIGNAVQRTTAILALDGEQVAERDESLGDLDGGDSEKDERIRAILDQARQRREGLT